jgi:hypothetical protein
MFSRITLNKFRIGQSRSRPPQHITSGLPVPVRARKVRVGPTTESTQHAAPVDLSRVRRPSSGPRIVGSGGLTLA